MTKVALFSGGDLSYFTREFDYFVGIDSGSLFFIGKWASFEYGRW